MEVVYGVGALVIIGMGIAPYVVIEFINEEIFSPTLLNNDYTKIVLWVTLVLHIVFWIGVGIVEVPWIYLPLELVLVASIVIWGYFKFKKMEVIQNRINRVENVVRKIVYFDAIPLKNQLINSMDRLDTDTLSIIDEAYQQIELMVPYDDGVRLRIEAYKQLVKSQPSSVFQSDNFTESNQRPAHKLEENDPLGIRHLLD